MNAKVAVFYFLNFLSLSFYEQQNGKDILINIIGDVIMGEVGKRRKKGTMKEYQSGNTARKSRSEWQRELMSSKVRKSEEKQNPVENLVSGKQCFGGDTLSKSKFVVTSATS
jgi:hypothetical protein